MLSPPARHRAPLDEAVLRATRVKLMRDLNHRRFDHGGASRILAALTEVTNALLRIEIDQAKALARQRAGKRRPGRPSTRPRPAPAADLFAA